MSSREPTLADVAELAGVSLTTVSRVLNNRGYLSEKTKKNVADAIETLGYRPNSLARALHGKRTQTVGLIVPAVSLPFFGELAVEVENALADAGYRILICNSMGRADREREYLSLLVGNRVDGIISGAHNEGLGEYDTIRMPLVTIDRELSPSIPNVRCANKEAGAMATRALNAALTEALEDGVDYDDLMNVRMDDGGQVSLLSANTMRMNALAERAGDAALRKLETVSAQKVDVPLGAALGLTLLAGSGPRIPISIVPVGSVQTDFETEFEACGINQTRHKVYLQLSASIRIVIPTGAKTTNVTANMLVAESIIVGKVPESFVGYRLSEEELNMAP